MHVILIMLYWKACTLGWADFHQSRPRSKKNFLGLGMGLERSQKNFQPNRSSNLVSRELLIF